MSTSVLIGYPSNSHVCAEFSEALAQMACAWMAKNEGDRTLQILNVQGSLLSNQRTKILKEALVQDCSHVLLLDSDMDFPHDTLDRLLAHNRQVVGINYLRKRFPAHPTAELPGGIRCYTREDSKGLEEVAQAGLGCMLIRTSVFRDLPEPWFPIAWHPGRKSYIGEDVFFLRTLRKTGVKLFIDHDLSKEVFHLGTFAYTNSMADLGTVDDGTE